MSPAMNTRMGLSRRAGASAPPIITQTAAPTFGPYTAGQTPAGVYTAGTYASTAGTISSATPQWTINGVSQPGSTVLIEGDVVGLSVLVTDSVANSRTFGYGAAAPAGAAAVAAILSGLAYAADLISVTTDTASGTIYYLLHNSVTPLSGAAIKSAVIGLTALGGGTLDPLDTDNVPIDWTAVPPGTYWINMVQDTGVFSNVVLLEVTIPVVIFDPADLPGARLVMDISNPATLFQDTAGTIPVTAAGQPVARVNNRGSLGGFFQNTGATDRPLYTEAAGRKQLDFDGSNDYIRINTGSVFGLTSGFWLWVLAYDDGTNTSFQSLGGFGRTGAFANENSGHAFHMRLQDGGTPTAIIPMFGLENSSGTTNQLRDNRTSNLPWSINEWEWLPNTNNPNYYGRMEKSSDGGVPVLIGSGQTAGSGFPNFASLTDMFIFGALQNSSGTPILFSKSSVAAMVLVSGTVTPTERDNIRAWLRSRAAF